VELYPSIDIRAGRVVRLFQGDYDRETVYDDDPVAVAARFADGGAAWIHVVDLDAARSGQPVNRATVAAIIDAVAGRAKVQASGGVRDVDAAAALADAGAARVVVGTAALQDPPLVARIAGRQPVAVGLDARRGELAVRGWVDRSGEDVFAVLPRFADVGVEALVVTEIERDGTLAGPDLEGLGEVLARTRLAVIASGGVGRIEDLSALSALEVDGRRLAGVIVGRALHEGQVSLGDALDAVAAH
jgi:phosphoribosylformimino-5-aminoimidazole carboxamide ribotide isomerase